MSGKIRLDAKSKLVEQAVKEEESSLGLIQNKSVSTVRSFRFRNSDIEKLNNLCKGVANINSDVIYNQTDMIRAAIFLLSQQSTEVILENIRKCK